MPTPNPNKKWWIRGGIAVFALAVVVGGILAAIYVPKPGWSTNDVTTGEHPGYPDLQPRTYDFPPEQTLRFAIAAANGIPRWRVVKTDYATGQVHVEVKTALFNFTDDLTLTILPTGEHHDSSKVMIRSHSRVGKGDLGENYRHIKALQAAMDDKLPQVQP